MKRRYRIEGIYDLRTLQALKEINIFDFAFDFRPKSMNFLQQHVFMDILKGTIGPAHKIYLIFENEQAFIVQKFLDDLAKAGISKDQIFLEFSDSQNHEYYDQFKTPYYLHFDPYSEAPVVSGEFFKGVIFSSKDFLNAKEDGRGPQFQEHLFRFLGKKSLDCEIFLHHDWDTDLYGSLFEIFDIDVCSLPINDKI